MICPNSSCRSSKSKVVDSRKEGEVVFRRRSCKCCGTGFNTCEVVTTERGTRLGTYRPVDKVATKRKQIQRVVANMEGVTAPAKIAASRAAATKRRRDAEDYSRYYSDEYVDSMVSDDEVKDLMDLFGE